MQKKNLKGGEYVRSAKCSPPGAPRGGGQSSKFKIQNIWLLGYYLASSTYPFILTKEMVKEIFHNEKLCQKSRSKIVIYIVKLFSHLCSLWLVKRQNQMGLFFFEETYGYPEGVI